MEAPRSLPTALHAMATAITGRARPPLFTTGPATRNALAAAGALGATTGTVVHLPSAPVMSAVLAHELMHTRSPVRRPRFFLDGVSGLLDDDERQALSAGKQAVSTGAGIVDQLPVGGGLGAVGDVASRAAKAAIMEATAGPMSSAQSLMGGAQSLIGGAQNAAGGAMDAASGMADQAMSAASGMADHAASAVQSAAHSAGDAASAAKNVLDPDKIVEIVESRLLREIERRGGRWAGMF